MTTFIDCGSGLTSMGLTCYGGEEELRAAVEGRPAPESAYRPRLGNIAPRVDDWEPRRGNTQTPPLTGPNKNQKPLQQQPRAPMFHEAPRKLLP